MTETEQMSRQDLAKRIYRLFKGSVLPFLVIEKIEKLIEADRKATEKKSEETIIRLRGHLQNCVNHLHKARGWNSRKFDPVIESANKVLYETLGH